MTNTAVYNTPCFAAETNAAFSSCPSANTIAITTGAAYAAPVFISLALLHISIIIIMDKFISFARKRNVL